MVPIFYDTIMIESNPTEGYWEIPLGLFDLLEPGIGGNNGSDGSYDLSKYGIAGQAYSDKYITVSNDSTTTNAEYISEFRNFTWYVDGDDDISPISNEDIEVVATDYGFWRIQIVSDIFGEDFGQYINVVFGIYPADEYEQGISSLPIRYFHFTLRRMPSSGGSGSSSGSSSSISVPTAPEIAAAVWNYGAEEGDDPITDRTLSTTVEVNPSAIAQAVWNYSVAEPASGTLGTRTLTTAIPTVANIATAVLTTDVGTMAVGTDDYTVKHLIMASQKSEVVTDNGATVWKIRDERLDSETNEATVIASRTLTINSNGAIVKTE